MKLLNFSLFIACFAGMLSSCSKTNSSKENLEVFRYNESANISTLDPAFSKNQANIWICNQIFNGLVQLNDSLEITPDIAKSWEISKDGKTYTFHLKKNIHFHPHEAFGASKTRTVTASDFVYSFDRLTDEKIASPGGWIMQAVERYYAINDSVFEIQLQRPFPAFLGLLSMKYASVIPHEVIENPNHKFRSHPIGTGPFIFKIWEENVKLVLRKNPHYHEINDKGERLPHLEAVSVTFLPDKQSGYLQFIQGNLDFVSGLDPSYKDDILTQDGKLQPKYTEQFKMLKSSYLNTEYLGFKMDNPSSPYQDLNLRLALNYGFDRFKMIQYLRNGIGIPATQGFLPIGLPLSKETKGFTYQPEIARKHLERFKSDNDLKEVKLILSTNASYLDIAEFLQQEWGKIGIQVSIDVSPPSTLRQAIATGKTDFFRASWIADYPDAENYLSLFYSKNFAPNGPNYTHYQNKNFDNLYLETFHITDKNERYAAYNELDAMIIQDAPIIPLFYDEVVRFTQTNVEGLGINPLNLLQLKNVIKREKKYHSKD